MGILRGRNMLDAARLAIACGAANAKTLLPGHVRPADVEQLTVGVEITAW